MSGKGSKPRPYSVSRDQFNSNWDKIFGSSDKDLAYESDNPLERPVEVHVHNDGHEVLVQETISEHFSDNGKRSAKVVRSIKGHSVELYERSRLVRTIDLFEKDISYVEDAAENWCLGVMV